MNVFLRTVVLIPFQTIYCLSDCTGRRHYQDIIELACTLGKVHPCCVHGLISGYITVVL